MSSLSWRPAIEVDGIFSAIKDNNPHFHNFNAVYIPYVTLVVELFSTNFLVVDDFHWKSILHKKSP